MILPSLLNLQETVTKAVTNNRLMLYVKATLLAAIASGYASYVSLKKDPDNSRSSVLGYI